ncbi:MAG: nucleotidyltransferase domain-containing protein, partial [Planctomycetota bacterium]
GILQWWLPRIQECLKEKLRSVQLFGSATLGDFCPGWSDVDVCILLSKPITEGEVKRIAQVHERMRNLFIGQGREGWASGQAIEGSYVPIPLAKDAGLEAPCALAGGAGVRLTVCHPFSPFDRYMLANFGLSWTGEPVRFSAPSEEALVWQAEKDLKDVLDRETGEGCSPIWLAGTIHWLARSLVFWREGTMLSKSEALRREIDRSSPYADAFRLALRIRQRGSGSAAAHEDALRSQFRAIARPAVLENRGMIR